MVQDLRGLRMWNMCTVLDILVASTNCQNTLSPLIRLDSLRMQLLSSWSILKKLSIMKNLKQIVKKINIWKAIDPNKNLNWHYFFHYNLCWLRESLHSSILLGSRWVIVLCEPGCRHSIIYSLFQLALIKKMLSSFLKKI